MDYELLKVLSCFILAICLTIKFFQMKPDDLLKLPDPVDSYNPHGMCGRCEYNKAYSEMLVDRLSNLENSIVLETTSDTDKFFNDLKDSKPEDNFYDD